MIVQPIETIYGSLAAPFSFLQFQYAADIYQLKMMRLLSNRARQNITYLCQNSIAWSNNEDVLSNNTVKVLTDDEVELHGHSKDTDVFLRVISDDCKVYLISNLLCLFPYIFAVIDIYAAKYICSLFSTI